MLLYIQEESADVQKENILKDLELRNLKYETVEEFLVDLKKKFEEGMRKGYWWKSSRVV